MESKAEMLSRVCMMAEGDQTWDLSDNDMRALRSVLAERNEYKQACLLSDLRIRDLEAQLAEARKDGARLDKLQEWMRCGRHDLIPRYRVFDGKVFANLIHPEDSVGVKSIKGNETLRAAIDAAMKGGKEK